MLLDDAHQALGWPEKRQILSPSGAGSKVYADFTESKIGVALRRKYPEVQVNMGILAMDPNDDATVAPLAVVCEFPLGASDEALEEAHRLAWNFSRTALLITLEPHRLIAWSCCQPPHGAIKDRQVCSLEQGGSAQESARWMLHQVGLVTGKLLRERPEKFLSDGRADTTLLENLKVIRSKLRAAGLPVEHCHDLLARVIFTQFLFHRRDREGRPFFDKKLLDGRCDGELRQVHADLASILKDKRETYALFRWLDARFNGDLFPGKDGQSEEVTKLAWRTEEDAVTEAHLALLADLVSGKIDAQSQQLALWPLYSFDVIPLEFISSVYEQFLSEERDGHKAYYTPAHLVDYVLDAVLPWNSKEWNIRVLDPSCGSGIFLVKAFQRLIYRWRRANGKDPLVSDLKPILARNLVGVDSHPEAVRVACFSLYLAMADAIEPRHYLKRGKVFPPLRGSRLLHRDFFDETTDGLRTAADRETYDLVLGNAPWGDGTIKTLSDVGPPTGRSRTPRTLAQSWAKTHGWPVVNYDIGPLFIAKGAALLRQGGLLAMIQSASVLNLRSSDADKLRATLFENYTFEEVTNLSIIRDGLFKGAFPSSAVLVFRRAKPDAGQAFPYLCPKPLHDPQAQHRFLIDPQDVHQITHDEAAHLPQVWSALLLGGRRDLDLILRLSRYPTLAKLEERGEIKSRQGVIPGNKKRLLDGHTEIRKRGGRTEEVVLPDLRDTHYFESSRFPKDVFLHLDQSATPIWDDPRTADTDSTDFGAFRSPQLLIKISYSRKDRRMRAVRVCASTAPWGVICKKTYLSACDLKGDGALLDTACVVYNSMIATWYLALTSSRLGHGRPEVLARELLDVPLPNASVDLHGLKTVKDVDKLAAKLFGLTETEILLIEECVHRTLPQAQHETSLSGYHATRRSGDSADDEAGIVAYADCILQVLSSTFGPRCKIGATVFEESSGSELLPVRIVTIHLDGSATGAVAVESMTAEGLMSALRGFYEDAMRPDQRGNSEGLGAQRVAFLFDRRAREQGMHLHIVKPDQRRYWTQSLALRDADDLSSAIFMGAERAIGDT